MAKLTAKKRNSLKTGSFALRGRRYPIEDASHARNALARVSQHGSPEEKKKVRAEVSKKYPGMGKKKSSDSKKKPSYHKAEGTRSGKRTTSAKKDFWG